MQKMAKKTLVSIIKPGNVFSMFLTFAALKLYVLSNGSQGPKKGRFSKNEKKHPQVYSSKLCF